TLPALVRENASSRPEHPALIENEHRLSYRELDQLLDQVAFSLQQDGFAAGDSIAICASNSINYAVLFLGALRAGVVVAPLAPSSTADSLQTMIRDSAARLVFVDAPVQQALAAIEAQLPALLSLDDSNPARGFS